MVTYYEFCVKVALQESQTADNCETAASPYPLHHGFFAEALEYAVRLIQQCGGSGAARYCHGGNGGTLPTERVSVFAFLVLG